MTSPTTVSIQLGRLGAPLLTNGRAPTFAEVGVERLAQEALQWQLLRAQGWFWETFATFDVQQQDRWLEIALLFGSVGESVLLAAAAEVEITLLRKALDDGRLSSGYFLALRFFAESQGQVVLSVGHRLTNLVARALMLDGSYPWGNRPPRAIHHRFIPFSDLPADWIAIEQVPQLLRIAPDSPHPGHLAMANAIESLHRHQAWRSLTIQRAVDFHRSRPESPFVSRPERISPWITTTHSRELRLGPSPPPDAALASKEIEMLALKSSQGLRALAAVMRQIRSGWLKAIPSVTGGHASIGRKGRLHVRPSARQSDVATRNVSHSTTK